MNGEHDEKIWRYYSDCLPAVSGLADVERNTALVLAVNQRDASRVETKGAVAIVRLEDGACIGNSKVINSVDCKMKCRSIWSNLIYFFIFLQPLPLVARGVQRCGP